MTGGANTDGAANGGRAADRLGRLANALVLIPLGLLLLVFFIKSLAWRTEHDVPLAHYSAFMHATYGTRPYAQLFQISFPQTILPHLGPPRLFGFHDRDVIVPHPHSL